MTLMAPQEKAVARPHLLAEVCDETGRPCITVPAAWLWDLVEYLSYDRVAVHYRNQGDVFVVCLEQSSVIAAQQIMDDWTHPSPEVSHHW